MEQGHGRFAEDGAEDDGLLEAAVACTSLSCACVREPQRGGGSEVEVACERNMGFMKEIACTIVYVSSTLHYNNRHVNVHSISDL